MKIFARFHRSGMEQYYTKFGLSKSSERTSAHHRPIDEKL